MSDDDENQEIPPQKPNTQFRLGNQLWKVRAKHGRNPIFNTPDELFEAALRYFQWVEDNPLYEMKAFAYQGVIVQEPVAKMQAMTIDGLCIYTGFSDDTWANYKKNPDFFGVTCEIEKIIRNQKFTGAAADLLNPNIIARDLGLVDKKDNISSDGSMTPITKIERVIVKK